MEWSDQQLDQLSQPQLRTLLDNLRTKQTAQRISSTDAERAAERINARLTPLAAPRKRRPVGHGELDKRVAGALGDVAERISARFDLSAETARKRSAGVKGFRPHTLTDRKGEAKVGAAVKSGVMSIERYISYRVGMTMVGLAYLLAAGQHERTGRYLLIGTDDVLPDAGPFDAIVPSDVLAGSAASERARMRAVAATDVLDAERRLVDKLATIALARDGSAVVA